MFFALWFFLIRPQSKRRKQEDEMRKNIDLGDDITTIGGIVGRIISIKDDGETFVLETGMDRSKILIKKWAISSNDTKNLERQQLLEQQKKEKQKLKEQKNNK
ncbi:MAG: preprotein translocase subunit YajC [Clostridia bacterium]|nr:preprotein translocase subunit YajC [Clostridia bacterium]